MAPPGPGPKTTSGARGRGQENLPGPGPKKFAGAGAKKIFRGLGPAGSVAKKKCRGRSRAPEDLGKYNSKEQKTQNPGVMRLEVRSKRDIKNKI